MVTGTEITSAHGAAATTKTIARPIHSDEEPAPSSGGTIASSNPASRTMGL